MRYFKTEPKPPTEIVKPLLKILEDQTRATRIISSAILKGFCMTARHCSLRAGSHFRCYKRCGTSGERSGTKNESLQGRHCFFRQRVRPRTQHSDWLKMTAPVILSHYDTNQRVGGDQIIIQTWIRKLQM